MSDEGSHNGKAKCAGGSCRALVPRKNAEDVSSAWKSSISCTCFVPARKWSTFCKFFRKNGGDDETRTRDLCRDRTYNNEGTAKPPVSRTRLHELWVGLWVGKSCRWPRARRTGNPLPNGSVSSCTPPVDLLYTEPHGSV